VTNLKVHKIENFFGFDFEICTISLLVMSKYYEFTENFFCLCHYWGSKDFPHSLKTTQNEKFFEVGQKFYFWFFSFMNPLYVPILFFPKFDLFTASEMALSVNLGPKCQNLFCLV